MANSERKQFLWPDYLVLVVVLLLSAVIGLYHGFLARKKETVQNYLLADRQLHWLPVGISILVTICSVITYTGAPAEGYLYGTANAWCSIGILLSGLLTAYVILPLLFPLKLTSSYEYLERRFKSKAVRMLGSAIGVLTFLLNNGLIVYATSITMSSVSGIPVLICIIGLTVLATVYTSLGGLRAVVWTDVFQFFIMIFGMAAILIQGSKEAGGVVNVWKIAKLSDRLEIPSFNPDPRIYYTMWSLVIGATFTFLASTGIQQSYIQRFSSVSNISSARKSIFFAVPGVVCLVISSTFLGIVAYSFFHRLGCDPLVNGDISDINQIIPYFVVNVLSFMPGFSGLYMSAIACATLSTVSSTLNSLSALLWDDMIRYRFKKLSDRRITIFLKCSVFVLGAVLVLLAVVFSQLKGTFLQITIAIFGATGGPLLGIYFLGAILPHANWIGACSGIVVSLVICLSLAFGTFVLPPVPGLPPAPVSECSSIDQHYNMTVALNFTSGPSSLTFDNMTSVRSQSGVTYDYTMHESLEDLGWASIFRISRLYYSFIGFVIAMIVGIAVSFLTGFTDPSTVEPELLFPVSARLFARSRSEKEKEAVMTSNEISTNHVKAAVNTSEAVLNNSAKLPI